MPTNQIQPQEFFLRPGFMLAHNETVLVRCVLGSCVAVALWDRRRHIGGINHFILPRFEKNYKPTVVFGNIAVPLLCRTLEKMGSARSSLEAQIFGGGVPPERFGATNRRELGTENLRVARSTLERLGIPVVSEDVGGCRGRKLIYNTMTNEAMIIKVNRLRRSDWRDFGLPLEWERA